MKRYHFLKDNEIYDAINRLKDAFLAADNGVDVEEIINAILTNDEKLRIGRRILIAEFLKSGLTVEETIRLLKVGSNTVMTVARSLEAHDKGFSLLEKRNRKVEKVYKKRSIRLAGASKKIIKKKVYTGFKRKAVKR